MIYVCITLRRALLERDLEREIDVRLPNRYVIYVCAALHCATHKFDHFHRRLGA